ncbi:Gfo/Idh/MocA family oxidoreductase [bacterium]|nr:Gfo/Idh/MocA family oxidoreductase [bacterium]
MGDKLKVGIVGFGTRGRGIVNNILSIDEYEIIGVCDIRKELKEDVEKIGKDVRFFTDYKKLLEQEDVEAIFISSPQFTHKEITLDSFKAGKHVYCEKPMATSIKECDEMIKGSKKYKKILMVGQQMRYHAHLNKMKEILDRGEIGKPVMLWIKEFRDPFPALWVYDYKKSGGTFVEKNCHHFDFFNWFSGSRPLRVFASASCDVIKEVNGIKSEIFDNGWVIIEYENGVRAMLGICMFLGIRTEREGKIGIHVREIGIAGEKGLMRTEGFELGKKIEVRYSENKNKLLYEVKTEGNIPTPYNQDGNKGILLKFYECVKRGGEPEVNGEAGKMAVAVSLAAEKSAKEKRVVKMEEIL